MKLRFIATLFFVPGVCLAADPCADTAQPEGNSTHTGCIAQEELAKADKELNRAYQELLAVVEKGDLAIKQKSALVDAQRAWIKFRDANCNMMGELNGGHPSWNSVVNLQCMVKVTKQRTTELRALEP